MGDGGVFFFGSEVEPRVDVAETRGAHGGGGGYVHLTGGSWGLEKESKNRIREKMISKKFMR